jgi:hypothetical protein
MLDPARARAEADAAERRGAGTLWADGPVAWEAVSVGAVPQPAVVPVGDPAVSPRPPDGRPIASVSRTEVRHATEDVPTALLTAILARLEMTAPSAGSVPAWLVDAVGDPRTYDAATTSRKDVCARVDPALYRRLQTMKQRLGLRTTAGAWEYVLRAGLAVAERTARQISQVAL